MKRVIAAHIDQVLWFSSKAEFDKYINQLKSKKQIYKVVWETDLGDGFMVRIKKQYNNNDFDAESEKG